jgi:hypothetical protein
MAREAARDPSRPAAIAAQPSFGSCRTAGPNGGGRTTARCRTRQPSGRSSRIMHRPCAFAHRPICSVSCPARRRRAGGCGDFRSGRLAVAVRRAGPAHRRLRGGHSFHADGRTGRGSAGSPATAATCGSRRASPASSPRRQGAQRGQRDLGERAVGFPAEPRVVGVLPSAQPDSSNARRAGCRRATAGAAWRRAGRCAAAGTAPACNVAHSGAAARVTVRNGRSRRSVPAGHRTAAG